MPPGHAPPPGVASNSTPAPVRPPGSFSPLPAVSPQTSAPQLRKIDSSDSDDSLLPTTAPSTKRAQNALAQQRTSPFTTAHPNSSATSLQNFSRPTTAHGRIAESIRTASPLTLPPKTSSSDFRTHSRKHSNSAGFFESSVPAAASIHPNIGSTGAMAGANGTLSASQIAAQAAMQHQQHSRQRSQTLPLDYNIGGPRKSSTTGPISPPLLSLTEASGERQSGFGSAGNQSYRNGLLGGGTSAATTAANVVFPRSPQQSPGLPPSDFRPPYREPEKPAAKEKTSKVKLFSRPGKISIGKETKDKPLPSPSKSFAMSNLQKTNMSTTSLVDSTMSGASNMYSMTNSSTATIRPVDTTPLEKEKDKKHHFLSRQKHKLSSKDDHHLPLSSAASNSRPVDPNAPSSLYSFDLPPSPGPTATSFAKSMSGLDLRHGGRALREKKKEEKAAAGSQTILRESEMTYGSGEWPGPSSLGSSGGPSFLALSSAYTGSSIYGETPDLTKYGLQNMTADDAWPFLRARLLIIFEGEDLRLPVEDFNKLVSTHLQRQIQKRSPNVIVEDLRDLLTTGFSSLDQTLRRMPDDKLIPHLVEMWLFTFTSILPYMQAVFLPLDLEFSGHGSLMSKNAAREFWGALPVSATSAEHSSTQLPAGQLLEVRRIVLTAYRDTVILPRFDNLKTIFSRLSLESINSNLNIIHQNSIEALSSSPDSFNTGGRPGTAMSLDPSLGSYNSQSTTLLGGGDSSGARSRAISNVSHGSDPSTTIPFPRLEPNTSSNTMSLPTRPFTPSSTHPSLLGLGLSNTGLSHTQGYAGAAVAQTQREANAEDSKQVTEIVGRMLQCMSVLASVGAGGAGDEVAQGKMEELCRALKLNWLGRGRTGRNRRGFVGARVTRGGSDAENGTGVGESRL